MAKNSTFSEKLVKAFDAREVLGMPSKVEEETEDLVPPKQEFTHKKSPKKQVLFKWEAPLKPKQTDANMKFVRSMGIIAIVVGLLLVAMQEFLLIIAIASLVFVRYLVVNSPTETVVHEISNHGLTFAGTFFPWEDVKQFYFVQQNETDMMLVDLIKDIPGRLFFVIHAHDREKLLDVVNDYVPYLENAPKDIMKDAYNSMLDKFTLSTQR